MSLDGRHVMRLRGCAAAVLAATATAGTVGCGDGHRAAAAPAPPRTPSPVVLEVRVTTGAPSGEHATALALGDGRALTVAHVLRADRPVFVGRRRARILRVDRRLDVALLAVPGLVAPAAVGGGASSGQHVTVCVLRDGATHGLAATVRRTVTAHVSAAGSSGVRPALELTAPVQPGDSGAPVVDDAGRVTGLVFAQASGRADQAYALDARALASLLAP